MPEEAVADIAVVGLGVNRQNLILGMNDDGIVVCAFSRAVEKVDKFLANEAKGTKVVGAHSIEEMVKKLKKPRRVMLMIKAGTPMDEFIDSTPHKGFLYKSLFCWLSQLVPHLERGDIIIGGVNSEYTDTQRRCKFLQEKGMLFVGTGVGGGKEGARYGPSLTSGGSKEAWPHVKHIFQSIAAKVGTEPCCDWVGEEDAGHFVKMANNGIKYGDMPQEEVEDIFSCEVDTDSPSPTPVSFGQMIRELSHKVAQETILKRKGTVISVKPDANSSVVIRHDSIAASGSSSGGTLSSADTPAGANKEDDSDEDCPVPPPRKSRKRACVNDDGLAVENEKPSEGTRRGIHDQAEPVEVEKIKATDKLASKRDSSAPKSQPKKKFGRNADDALQTLQESSDDSVIIIDVPPPSDKSRRGLAADALLNNDEKGRKPKAVPEVPDGGAARTHFRAEKAASVGPKVGRKKLAAKRQ